MYLPKLFLAATMVLCCTVPVDAAKYYCYNSAGQNLGNINIYDTNEDCTLLYRNESYNQCQHRLAIARNMYNQGSCVPVYIKRYSIGESRCKVAVASLFNKPLSYSCVGGDTDFAMRNIQKYYAQYL